MYIYNFHAYVIIGNTSDTKERSFILNVSLTKIILKNIIKICENVLNGVRAYMGTYFNPNNESFTRDKNSKI